MNKRNIRHGFKDSGLTDDDIDSYDVAGPIGMASAITFLGGEWPNDSQWGCELPGGPRHSGHARGFSGVRNF